MAVVVIVTQTQLHPMFPSPLLPKALLLLSLSVLLLCFQLALLLVNLDDFAKLLGRRSHWQNEQELVRVGQNLEEVAVEKESKRIVAADAKNDEFIGAPSGEEGNGTWRDFGDQFAFEWPPNLTLSHPLENSCRFPVLQPDEPDLLPHIRHFRHVHCPPPHARHVPLVGQLRNGQLLFGTPHRANLSTMPTCWARQLGGTLRPRVRRFDWIGNWTRLPQNRLLMPKWEQFVVKCFDWQQKLVFHDAFTSVVPKPTPNVTKRKADNPFGISLFIIDSTARTHFLRHMPLTGQFLQNNGFRLMQGYTKAGDNSAINLLAVLAGMVYQQEERGFQAKWFRPEAVLAEETIQNKKMDFWQGLDSSLFRLAKDAGFDTLWNDEIATSGFGLFHYNAFKGFLQPPADHYFRPFYEYIYQRLGASSGCINGQFAASRFVDIWERFASAYPNRPQLALNFLTGLTHASANNLELLDGPFSDVFGRLKLAGHFERNFVLVMGDHGQRISPIQRSHSGRVEERMPLLAISVPPAFARKWPEKVRRLTENQNRLISNFDVFQTLAEILLLSAQFPGPAGVLWKFQIERVKANRPGLSLFGPLPAERSCPDARVPHQFCCCMEQTASARVPQDFLERTSLLLQEHFGNILSPSSLAKNNKNHSKCLGSNFQLDLDRQFRIFRLNAQTRAGVRSPVHLRKLEAQHGAEGWQVDEDVFEIELGMRLSTTATTLADNRSNNSTQLEVKLLARIGIHLGGQQQQQQEALLLLRGEPLLVGWHQPIQGACAAGNEQGEGRKVFTLDGLCSCLENKE